jgi:hypothetical protein
MELLAPGYHRNELTARVHDVFSGARADLPLLRHTGVDMQTSVGNISKSWGKLTSKGDRRRVHKFLAYWYHAPTLQNHQGRC